MRVTILLLTACALVGCEQETTSTPSSSGTSVSKGNQAIIQPPDPTAEPMQRGDWKKRAASDLGEDSKSETTGGEGLETVSTGKMIYIYDGDTAQVRIGDRNVKVRLNGIDAPESKQPFGTKAKQALREFAGKPVRLVKTGEDSYGRVLGDLFSGDEEESINLKLVRDGFAWHYKRFSQDEALAAAETEARENKRGLWSGSEKPVPPWTWRREHADDR